MQVVSMNEKRRNTGGNFGVITLRYGDKVGLERLLIGSLWIPACGQLSLTDTDSDLNTSFSFSLETWVHEIEQSSII